MFFRFRIKLKLVFKCWIFTNRKQVGLLKVWSCHLCISCTVWTFDIFGYFSSNACYIIYNLTKCKMVSLWQYDCVLVLRMMGPDRLVNRSVVSGIWLRNARDVCPACVLFLYLSSMQFRSEHCCLVGTFYSVLPRHFYCIAHFNYTELSQSLSLSLCRMLGYTKPNQWVAKGIM